MNCTEFKNWLGLKERLDVGYEEAAREHASRCRDCARLLKLDEDAESALSDGLARVNAPASLRVGVAFLVQDKDRGRRRRWPLLAVPATALAALMMFFLVIQPSGVDFGSVGQIASLAEQGHMGAFALEFRADEEQDIPSWFQGMVDAAPTLPGLEMLELVGGRTHRFGAREVPHLAYQGEGKRYSLFTLAASDLGFDMEETKAYSYPVNQCSVKIWKVRNRVYVLVV